MTLRSDPETTRAWQRRSAKPLPRFSERRRIFNAEFKAASKIVHARSGGMCELNWLGCRERADHVHHIRGRIVPDANDPKWLIDLCSDHHREAHNNPNVAYALGLMSKRNGIRSDRPRLDAYHVDGTPPAVEAAGSVSPFSSSSPAAAPSLPAEPLRSVPGSSEGHLDGEFRREHA